MKVPSPSIVFSKGELMGGLKWYRVIDPLSPLYGCDVSGYDASNLGQVPSGTYLNLTAMRRIDIFVGDRPFQLVAPKNENLGLMILFQQLEESPLQDELVELSTTRPHGKCVDDSYEVERSDGSRLKIVQYERIFQVALASKSALISSNYIKSLASIQTLKAMFERGDDIDDLVYFIDEVGS